MSLAQSQARRRGPAVWPHFIRRVVEKILQHLGPWHDALAGLPPPGATGAYTCEAYNEDPMPDYENVITD
jgi:hypothetical protein